MKENKKQNLINPSAEPQSEAELKGIESKLTELFASTKASESEAALPGLDAKLAKKMQAKGENKLAKTFDRMSKKAAKEENAKKYSIKRDFGFWFGWSLSTFGIMFIVLGGMFYYLQNKPDGTNTNDIAALKDTLINPQLTLKPTQFTSEGYVASNSAFVIELPAKVDGDVADYIDISPKVAFTTQIEKTDDGKYLVALQPKETLDTATNYNVVVSADMSFTDGTKLKSDVEWDLPIEPRLEVLNINPRNSLQEVALDSNIEFEINYENASVEAFKENFRISPQTEGEFTVEARKLIFKPSSPLKPDTEYSVCLFEGFNINNDKKLVTDYTSKFKTASLKVTQEVKNSFVAFRSTTTTVSAPVNNGAINISEPIVTTNLIGDVTAVLSKYSATTSTKLSSFSFDIDQFKKVKTDKLTGTNPIYTASLEKGVYKLEVSVPNGVEKATKLILVSDYKVIVDKTALGNEGWVIETISGNPVANLTIAQFDSQLKGIENAKSDADSHFILNKNASWLYINANSNQTVVDLSKSTTFTSDQYISRVVQAQLNFDKTEYLAGEILNLEGLVDSQGLVTPEGVHTLTLKFYDQKGNLLDKKSSEITPEPYYSLNSDGTRSLFAELSKRSIKYQYKANQADASIVIAEYIVNENLVSTAYAKVTTPEATLNYSIVTAKKVYKQGESVTALIQALDSKLVPLNDKKLVLEVRKSSVLIPNTNIDIQKLRTQSVRGQTLVELTPIKLDETGIAKVIYTPVIESKNDVLKDVYTLTLFDGERQVTSESFEIYNSYYIVNNREVTYESVNQSAYNAKISFEILTFDETLPLDKQINVELCRALNSEKCLTQKVESNSKGLFEVKFNNIESDIYDAKVTFDDYSHTFKVLIGAEGGWGAGGTSGNFNVEDKNNASLDFVSMLDAQYIFTSSSQYEGKALMIEQTGNTVTKYPLAKDGLVILPLSSSFDSAKSSLNVILPVKEGERYYWVVYTYIPNNE
ncbi:MAG: hypothetical protein Fur003_0630 [Candidatus Dojkabacteria bacterium]